MALIRLLTKAGVLDHEKAEEIRRVLERDPGQIDAVLDHVDEKDLARVLSEELGVPLIEVARDALRPEAIRLVPRELARRYDAVPVRLEGHSLLVAFINPLDQSAIKAIEFGARCRLHVAVARASQVRDAINFAYEFQREVSKRLTEASTTERVEILEPAFDEEMDRLLNGHPDPSSAVRLVELILVEGLEHGASDIHIEPTATAVNVRYRIHGVMETGVTVPKTLQNQLVGRIKVMAALDISERRKPQDGSLSVRHEHHRVDVRVSILPTPFGEKIVLRLLDTEAHSPSLELLGLPEESRKLVEREIHRPEGMLLITGPTGSGKTTTAHAFLTEIAKSPLNIVSIENPIEYRLKSVTQVEINEKQGVTFAGTLRSILRQDPDVVFVGEIRDQETAEIGLRASHTGHLVLSTLHTIDAASSISRLLDLGVDAWMVAGSLRMVIAQRLLRELCPACRVAHQPTAEELHRLGARAEELDQAFKGRGCRKCRNRGYVGRFSLCEVLPVSAAIRSMIERRAPETELRAQARAEGVESMHAQALAWIRAGRSTVEEVMRVIPPDGSAEARMTERHARAAAHAPAAAPATARQAHDAAQPGRETGQEAHEAVSPPGALIDRAPVAVAAAGASNGTKHATTPAATPTPSGRAAICGLDDEVAAEEPTVLHVLVVDDEPVNRTIIRLCLNKVKLPIRALEAEDGPSALAVMATDTVHLALVDLMMPGMSGIELCERLRADPRYANMPIFMLTAVEDTPNKTSAFAAGIDDYLVKPVNAAELVARVTRALQRYYPQVVARAPTAAPGAAAGAGEGSPIVH